MRRMLDLTQGGRTDGGRADNKQMFEKMTKLFVDSGITGDFLSTGQVMPGGGVRDLGADGQLVESSTLTLPTNDRFMEILPLGPQVDSYSDDPLRLVVPRLNGGVFFATKNVTVRLFGTYGEGDPRKPYLGNTIHWMFDGVMAREGDGRTEFSGLNPREALVLLATSALAHGIRDGKLGGMFMDIMHSSPRRSGREAGVTRELLHSAFVGLSVETRS